MALLVAFGVMVVPTLFTKNISRIEATQSFSLEDILNAEQSVELIFFGYAGCSDICTPRLASLALFYKALPMEMQEHLGVRFIDISNAQDATLSQRFASYFHKDFVGITPQSRSLREYTKPFDVYFAPSFQDAGEFDHTAHLYLVSKRKGIKQIRYIYTAYPYDFKQIRSDIKELLNE